MIPRPMDESSKKFIMYLKTRKLFTAWDGMIPIQLTPWHRIDSLVSLVVSSFEA
jgi:hypothetical protein